MECRHQQTWGLLEQVPLQSQTGGHHLCRYSGWNTGQNNDNKRGEQGRKRWPRVNVSVECIMYVFWQYHQIVQCDRSQGSYLLHKSNAKMITAFYAITFSVVKLFSNLKTCYLYQGFSNAARDPFLFGLQNAFKMHSKKNKVYVALESRFWNGRPWPASQNIWEPLTYKYVGLYCIWVY